MGNPWHLLTIWSSRRCGPKELLRVVRAHWRIDNSLRHVKDHSWDEDVHVLRRLCLDEIYDTLVGTALNALNPEDWFPLGMPMPLQAKCCAFHPVQTITGLSGLTP